MLVEIGSGADASIKVQHCGFVSSRDTPQCDGVVKSSREAYDVDRHRYWSRRVDKSAAYGFVSSSDTPRCDGVVEDGGVGRILAPEAQ